MENNLSTHITRSLMQPLYTMPVPPVENHPDHDYYQPFVRAMNRLPRQTATGEKLLSAIAQTATTMGTSESHVARLLVDYGLRAPRDAFPASFVEFVDRYPIPRNAVERAALDTDVIELKDFWTSLAQTATVSDLAMERA
jgi:hypothetical protein